MVHHAIKGALGMLPQQALIFDYDIGNHCLQSGIALAILQFVNLR